MKFSSTLVNSIKKIVIIFLVINLGLLATCDKKSNEKEEIVEDVTISINSWIGWAPLYLGIEKGFFENNKTEVNLNLKRVEDTGIRKNSMITGRVDGYASSVDNFALDAAQGVPGKIVMCFDESYGGDGIIAKANIETIEDLKGKRIAVQPGLIGHFLLLYILNEHGLDINDFKLINMDSDKAGAAFVSGKIPAAVTWEPWLSRAVSETDGHILLTTKDAPGVIVDALVLRDEILAKTNVVNTILIGWFKSLKYWNKYPEDSNKIMADAYNLEIELFKEMCSGVRFYDYQRNKDYFFNNGKHGQIFNIFKKAGVLWKEADIISKLYPADQAIDPDYIKNLYRKK